MLSSLGARKNILYLINKYSSFIPRVELEVLLSYVFNCTKIGLYTDDAVVDEGLENLCELFIRRRLSGEPLQYITGSSEFMGLDFIVRKDVFIPRPETEAMVKEVLSAFNHQLLAERKLRILDLCTGSGNIAISLAKLLPQAEVVATDISGAALSIALQNSIRHGVDGRVLFLIGDLFCALQGPKHYGLNRGFPIDKKYRFDIIVSNPPYIKRPELDYLQEEVKHEPRHALDGGFDGLDFYRRIAGDVSSYLKPGGSLFLEMGLGQVEKIMDIFGSEGSFKIHRVKKDFSGIKRVIWIDLS